MRRAGGTGELPAFLTRMVRRPAPGPEVVRGSTPVVAFGEPSAARVATLGINPSKSEFTAGGRLLTGPHRRLATLESLDAGSTESLTDDQIRTVVEDCAAYFHNDRNPYRRWFDPLNQILKAGVDSSYYDGTACHLDLVQWATDPVWSGLTRKAQALLLEDGVSHLREQLHASSLKLVVLNGRQVLDQVEASGLARLTPAGALRVGSVACSLFLGEGEGIRFAGWSTNIQSSFGVTRELRSQIAGWLADAGAAPGDGEEMRSDDVLNEAGYIARGTTARGKSELFELLNRWLAESRTPTIGDVGSYGGSPCIHIDLADGITAVLNADTKRAAVGAYAADARVRGSTAPWSLVPNRRGRINKINFAAGGTDTPGWYCYLARPLPASAGTSLARYGLTGASAQPRIADTQPASSRSDAGEGTSAEVRFVQFPHPGGEHAPDAAGRKGWNRRWRDQEHEHGRDEHQEKKPISHARKFMQIRGKYLAGGEEHESDLWFWGEWEPESDLLAEFADRDGVHPRYLWSPYYRRPEPGAREALHNTDPFVFGGFYYTNCRQSANPSLKQLPPGSVIAFGSTLHGAFVLDTAFVVGPGQVRHERDNHAALLAGVVPDAYWDVTLGPTYAYDGSDQEDFRLYVGATHDQPYDDMFSFFPCLPADPGGRGGFARPVIELPDYVNPKSWRSLTGLRRPVAPERARDLWDSITGQVEAQGLVLGVHADVPPRRE